MKVGGKLAFLEHTMEDTWTRIVDLFAERGIECTFTFGPQNRELNGKPPRIHFERASGSVLLSGVRSGNGELASIVQACTARIWGLQAGEDYGKHQCLGAIGLLVELVGAFYAVAPDSKPSSGGSGVTIEYSPETHVLHYGEQVLATFQFVAPIKWATDETSLAIGGIDATLNTRTR